MHGARIRIDINATPATPIEKAGVGKPEAVVGANIDIDVGASVREHPIEHQVLGFLRE